MNKFISIVAITLIWSCSPPGKESELPILGHKIYEEHDTIYHTVDHFVLLDQDSTLVSNETLSNKVYVADFFFTSCPTICPKMKAEMLRVYNEFEDQPQLTILSHTIDPEYDTIPLLKDYAKRLGADSQRWKFLWGDQDDIYELAEKSYMSIADEDGAAPGGFVHSGAFLLVDKERRIRGMYDGTDADQVDVLINDIKKLIKSYDQAGS
ncbi:MAG: SCO family protein [Bacteroidota bacterium]